MELKSMKMSDEEAAKGEPCAVVDPPAYPYGLSITLNDETITKLGLAALPAAGQKMMLHARVEVTSVSQYEQKDNDKERSIGLQITDMAVEADRGEADAATVMYGS